jgi:aerobic carbon-monoxide dehydrogenase medium subunit
MNWNRYEKPRSLKEALVLLKEANGEGRVIAGGTDLVIQLRRGERVADLLVDITGIEELKGIREEDGWVRIGARATHGEVARHPLIHDVVKALAQGCSLVGSPQIRNIATLAGNVITAQPAADGAIPLMVLEAELKVVSGEGERWVAIEDTYRGIGLSAIDATREVVSEIRFRKPGNECETAFFRMARRKALALPILNGAVSIKINAAGDGIETAMIAIGPVAERPFRSRKAEACLESAGISRENLLEACRIASEEANPRTSLRGSALYRREMIKVNLFRTIEKLIDELRKRK